MSETVREWLKSLGPLGEELALDGSRLSYFVPQLLDAHIYRSCPECGGSRKRQPDYDTTFVEYGVCPACKDAPVAIVDAALREKAIVEAEAIYNRNGLMVIGDEVVDAVLSTVLGQVRYAKEILEGTIDVHDSASTQGAFVYVGGKTRGENLLGIQGQHRAIAILEEAGKEE